MKKEFKEIIKKIAECSKNKKLKVGAAILKDNRIISLGYNGQLPGEPHKPIERNSHDISTVHAEQNCLMFCAKNSISTKNCELLTTHFPCKDCTKLAIMAGIKTIYYIKDYKNKLNIFRNKISIIKI